MALDWLPVRLTLKNDVRVLSIARKLKVLRVAVMGALLDLWTDANYQTTNGVFKNHDIETIDETCGIPGFAKALIEVGWLVVDGASVIVPNFSEHNGQSAKSRALDAQRKARERAESARKARTQTVIPERNSPAVLDKKTVTPRRKPKNVNDLQETQARDIRTQPDSFGQDRTKSGQEQVQQQEQERREKKTPISPVPGDLFGEAKPKKSSDQNQDIFDQFLSDNPIFAESQTFQESWDCFITSRKQIRKPMTPIAATRTLKQFPEWGVEEAIAALETSTASGWSGVFRPKHPQNGQRAGASGWQGGNSVGAARQQTIEEVVAEDIAKRERAKQELIAVLRQREKEMNARMEAKRCEQRVAV